MKPFRYLNPKRRHGRNSCNEEGLDAKKTRKGFAIDVPWGEAGVCYFLEGLSEDTEPNEKVIFNSIQQLLSIYER